MVYGGKRERERAVRTCRCTGQEWQTGADFAALDTRRRVAGAGEVDEEQEGRKEEHGRQREEGKRCNLSWNLEGDTRVGQGRHMKGRQKWMEHLENEKRSESLGIVILVRIAIIPLLRSLLGF